MKMRHYSTTKAVIAIVLFWQEANVFGFKAWLNYWLGFDNSSKTRIYRVPLDFAEAFISKFVSRNLLLLFHLWDVERVGVLLGLSYILVHMQSIQLRRRFLFYLFYFYLRFLR